MSTAATQHVPAIPPRPSRGHDKATMPAIPPRPTNRRLDRSVSPNIDRFAPSPLNESPFPSRSPHGLRFGSSNGNHNGDPIARPTSVELPSVGEEGAEYAGLTAELEPSPSSEDSLGPEQTHTVGADLKLHAPKPSLPAMSAKQRFMTVTRTDSDRAAAFGIGRPSSREEGPSLKKKASTTSQLSGSDSHVDDEHGIPEIGKQVPMYPNAGDVQAPSPAPGPNGAEKTKHHSRRGSARGNLPPGSYGLHGHGVVAQDKLEKAYYEKHPDLLKQEHTPHHYDRPTDFSMSSDALNRIVRDTASRGSGLAAKNYAATPSEQVGWQAIEETTSRVASPRPSSMDFKAAGLIPGIETSGPASETEDQHSSEEIEVIHVDEPNQRKSVSFSGDELLQFEESDEHPYMAPILAEDEVAKDPAPYDYHPAVDLPPERSGSAFEMDEPVSRPTSRPASLRKSSSFELRPTPLEDVEEYEPLFPEDEKSELAKKTAAEKIKAEHMPRFPSRDIWEDAPNSAYHTAEVSTPEVADESSEATAQHDAIPSAPERETETPAQAFARHQEELAEKEAHELGADGFVATRGQQTPVWAQPQPQHHHQHHGFLADEMDNHLSVPQRFPSRDVWEDTPDSLKLEATVSTPQQEEEEASVMAATAQIAQQRPVRKPVETSEKDSKPMIPERPKPKHSGDDKKPAIPERPLKPQVPERPSRKTSPAPPTGAKPVIPARPTGGKIAALQAGFMSDLNNRLRLGPQAPRKVSGESSVGEDASAAAAAEEEKKVPLSDARKGRARGPQRRAPGKSPAPVVAEPAAAATAAGAEAKQSIALGFSMPTTLFVIDPEDDVLNAGEAAADAAPVEVLEKEEEEKEGKEEVEEKKVEGAGADADADADADVQPELISSDVGAAAPPASEEAPAHAQLEPEAGAGEEPAENEGEAQQVVKSLATNMAGEPVVEGRLAVDEEKQEVEPVEVEEH